MAEIKTKICDSCKKTISENTCDFCGGDMCDGCGLRVGLSLGFSNFDNYHQNSESIPIRAFSCKKCMDNVVGIDNNDFSEKFVKDIKKMILSNIKKILIFKNLKDKKPDGTAN